MVSGSRNMDQKSSRWGKLQDESVCMKGVAEWFPNGGGGKLLKSKMEYDMKIVLVSKCSLDIEQYVEFKMSVLMSPSKSLINSHWVTYNLRAGTCIARLWEKSKILKRERKKRQDGINPPKKQDLARLSHILKWDKPQTTNTNWHPIFYPPPSILK